MTLPIYIDYLKMGKPVIAHYSNYHVVSTFGSLAAGCGFEPKQRI